MFLIGKSRIVVICIILVFGNINLNAQMYLKGSAIGNIGFVADFISGTIGAEYKYKKIGIEYFRNGFFGLGEWGYQSTTDNISVKYYFINMPDSSGTFKYYISSFAQYKKIHDVGETWDMATKKVVGYDFQERGLGYGILIGGIKDLKWFGFEPGLYCYYYLPDKSLNPGVRMYLYLKFPKTKVLRFENN